MPEKSKEFYYTNEDMVKDLLSITPISGSVLDAGSGNKVWFNNLSGEKYECEIERGCDFYKWDKKVDWVVGNPPFRDKKEGQNQIPIWIEKASEIAQQGMAFLLNHKVMNFLTTSRLEKLKEKGFYLQHIRVVADKRWFGRYFYLIFGREDKGLVSWNKKNY